MAREKIQRVLGINDYLFELSTRTGPLHGIRLDAAGVTSEPRRPYLLEDGVAIINISGVLCDEAWYYDETEYDEIQAEVEFALNDSAAKGILLRIDSPGGMVDGAFECASFLQEAAKQKPMWACADKIAYSAAYLLASQTSKIYAPFYTGGVGSVGVYMMHADYSEALKQRGIAVTFISAGKGKVDGNPYEPLDDETKKRWTAEIDRLYGHFVNFVASGRKMSESEVKSLGAYCYQGGKTILRTGLADVIGSIEQAWGDLKLVVNASSSLSGQASASAATAVLNQQGEGEMKEGQTTSAAPDAKAPPATEAAVTPAVDNSTVNNSGRVMSQAEIDQLVTAARSEGEASADNRVSEIIALCNLAKKPGMAAQFISEKKTKEQVSAALTALANSEDSKEISNHTPTGAKTEESPIISACDKIGARMRATKGVK